MLSRVLSAALLGIDAKPVEVEMDVSNRGLPHFTVVGLPDGMNIQKSSGLGMVVAQSLTKQIKGGFDCKVYDGTALNISFRVD